jgi:hypothetical protein
LPALQAIPQPALFFAKLRGFAQVPKFLNGIWEPASPILD